MKTTVHPADAVMLLALTTFVLFLVFMIAGVAALVVVLT